MEYLAVVRLLGFKARKLLMNRNMVRGHYYKSVRRDLDVYMKHSEISNSNKQT